MIHPFFLYAAVVIGCVGLFGAVVMYRRVKKAKGNFEVVLKKGRANFTDSVDGEVKLQCHQDIDLRSVEVTLSSFLRTRSGTTSGPGTRRTTYSESKIYTHTVVLRDAALLDAGTSENFPFSIQMPSPHFDGPDEKELRRHFTLKNQRDIRWEVRARVRCKGVDLDDKARLVVPYISEHHRQAA